MAYDSRSNKMRKQDAVALDEAEQTNPITVLLSGYTAALAAGFGAAFRIRRYYKEV